MAEKKFYSFLGIEKIVDGEKNTVGVLEGMVTKNELKEVNGKKILSIDIVSNNVAKKLNYALGGKLPETDSTFVRVNLWEDLAQRGAKILAKGAVVDMFGRFALKSYTNKDGEIVQYVELNAREFKIVRFAKAEENNGEKPETSSNSTPAKNPNPVENDIGDIPF